MEDKRIIEDKEAMAEHEMLVARQKQKELEREAEKEAEKDERMREREDAYLERKRELEERLELAKKKRELQSIKTETGKLKKETFKESITGRAFSATASGIRGFSRGFSERRSLASRRPMSVRRVKNQNVSLFGFGQAPARVAPISKKRKRVKKKKNRKGKRKTPKRRRSIPARVKQPIQQGYIRL